MSVNAEDEPSATGSIADAAAAASSAVGDTLRSARERLGKPLAEVAGLLRIRQPYLLALEEGRHKDLPGGTYAIGFLRTYAEFLGLDGEEMVRRFRQDAAADLNSRSELAFPSPVSEGRIPSGGILFLGLLVAAAAYGGWYWMTARQGRVAEIVPPLPERLSSVLNRPAALTADSQTTPKADEPAQPQSAPSQPAITAETAPAEAVKPMAKEDVIPPPEEEDAAKAPAPPPSAPATAQPPAAPAPTPTAAPASTAPMAAKVVPPTKAPEPAKPADTTKPAPPAKPTETVKAVEAPQPAADTAAPPAAPAASVAPSNAAESRVALRAANDDCWVQLREMDGRLLMSRLLRKGEVLPVPNRPGLSLTLGNAGALEISVDGQKLPILGPSGQVRHDINLDPAKLLAGAKTPG